MNYCPNCGSSVYDGANFCEGCGEKLDEISPSSQDEHNSSQDAFSSETSNDTNGLERSPPSEQYTPQQSIPDTFFNATIALSGAYVLLMIIALSSAPSVGILAILCIVGSIITMAIDLSKIDDALWDTSTVLWVVGTVVLWIVVMPIYIYKRSQAVKGRSTH